MGSYHFGVISALLERGLIPKVIAGSSVGSVIAAFVATQSDKELLNTIWNSPNIYYIFDKANENTLQSYIDRFKYVLFLYNFIFHYI